MAETGKTTAKQKFMLFLEQKNLRITSQRQAIVDTVFSTDKHFTAEQLLDWSRQRDKSVSRATVYRTLPLMTESHILREVDIGSGEKFYRPNREGDQTQVAQVVCLDCDKLANRKRRAKLRGDLEAVQRLQREQDQLGLHTYPLPGPRKSQEKH